MNSQPFNTDNFKMK